MKKVFLSLFLLFILFTINGCGTGGTFTALNNTNVELSQSNYNIIAKDVSGSSVQGYILGFSFTQGAQVSAFGFVRAAGTDKLYDTAVKELWKNYEEKYGSKEGKKLALINIRQDSELLNTIVYTQVKHFITADVIEFVD